MLLTSVVNSFDSDRGFCIEAESITLRITHPQMKPQTSEKYIFPQLIDEYKNKVAGRIPELRDTYERMVSWPDRSGGETDQLSVVTRLLADSTGSRMGIISLWDPEIDLRSSRPMSPCLLYFSIRRNSLNMSIIARSADAWVGALPEMIALSDLQQDISDELKLSIGCLNYHVLSYHLYEYDLLPASQSLI